MRITIFFYSLYKVFYTALLNITGIRSDDRKKNIAAVSLLSTTFRIPEKDRFSLLKTLLYLLRSVVKTPVKKITLPTSDKLIFDISSSDRDLRINYTKYFTGAQAIDYTDYNSLNVYPSFSQKIVCVLVFCLILPVFAFVALFIPKEKRAAASLLIEEIIVLSNLLWICRTNNIKVTYHFSIYEVFSNLFAEALLSEQIKVVKIPSEVPLAMWNKKILASVLVICNAYQLEEVEAYKETMLFDSTEFWGPELILDIKDLYKKEGHSKPEFTLGFYSTGGWLRKLLGHIDQGMKIEEQEMKVKRVLAQYALKKGISIGVFLHPREKKEEYLEHTKKHYEQVFRGVNYTFMPFDTANNKMFNKVDLAVAFNTTIMYERLYCGFKCLLVPLELNNFPLVNSPIKNICAFNEEEMEKKIEVFTAIDKKTYFRDNNLTAYAGLDNLV